MIGMGMLKYCKSLFLIAGISSIFLILISAILSLIIIQPFHCGCCILNPWDALSAFPEPHKHHHHNFSNQSPRKALVFFPGHGETTGRRTDILRQSVSTYDPKVWDCIVFYYGTERPPDTWMASFEPCQVIHEPGLAFGDWMKMISPTLVEKYNYTHVCVHINDVQYQHDVNPSDIIADMDYLGLDMASPNVIGSIWSSMCSDSVPVSWFEVGWLGTSTRPLGKYEKGSRVKFIEIQVTFFTSKAWSCWWEMVNQEINPYGWNYDQCFFRFCMEPEMGILGGYNAIHWGRYPEFVGGVQSTMAYSHFNLSSKEVYRGWLVEKFREKYQVDTTMEELCLG